MQYSLILYKQRFIQISKKEATIVVKAFTDPELKVWSFPVDEILMVSGTGGEEEGTDNGSIGLPGIDF